MGKYRFPDATELTEIGRVGLIQQVDLTEILLNDETELASYGGEIPASLAVVDRSIAFPNGEFIQLRMEVKSDPIPGKLNKQSLLCVTELPYRKSWVAFQPFKRGRKGRAVDFPEIASRDDAFDFLRHLQVDYWENGTAITAGIDESSYSKTLDSSATTAWSGRSLSLAALTPAAGSITSGDRFLSNLEQAIWRSDRVQRILSGITNRTYKFYHKDHYKPWTPELEAEAPSLLWLSVRQALAGPHQIHGQGDLVLDTAELLFRDHLDRIAKRVEQDHGSMEEEDPEMFVAGVKQAARFLAFTGD